MEKYFRITSLIILMLGLVPAGLAQVPDGLFTDPRDGQSYETIVIGHQTWLAENMNYGDAVKTCYDNDPANCKLYGGLYTWEVAQDVCPESWHLPVTEEWEALAIFLGKKESGQKIKASPENPLSWDGTNESGFTALPSGAGNGEGFHRKGDWALFWSASPYNNQRAWFAQLDGFWYEQPPKYKNIYVGWYYLKSNQFSVRCIKDKDEL